MMNQKHMVLVLPCLQEESLVLFKEILVLFHLCAVVTINHSRYIDSFFVLPILISVILIQFNFTNGCPTMKPGQNQCCGSFIKKVPHVGCLLAAFSAFLPRHDLFPLSYNAGLWIFLPLSPSALHYLFVCVSYLFC